MKSVVKFIAKRCENCPLCNHARENPETLFGKVMAFHGKICPFWKAWEREYGHEAGHDCAETVSGQD